MRRREGRESGTVKGLRPLPGVRAGAPDRQGHTRQQQAEGTGASPPPGVLRSEPGRGALEAALPRKPAGLRMLCVTLVPAQVHLAQVSDREPRGVLAQAWVKALEGIEVRPQNSAKETNQCEQGVQRGALRST